MRFRTGSRRRFLDAHRAKGLDRRLRRPWAVAFADLRPTGGSFSRQTAPPVGWHNRRPLVPPPCPGIGPCPAPSRAPAAAATATPAHAPQSSSSSMPSAILFRSASAQASGVLG